MRTQLPSLERTSDINIFFEGETIEQFGGGDVLSAPASRPKFMEAFCMAFTPVIY